MDGNGRHDVEGVLQRQGRVGGGWVRMAMWKALKVKRRAEGQGKGKSRHHDDRLRGLS